MPILRDALHTNKFSDANMRPKDWLDYLIYRKINSMAVLTMLLSYGKPGRTLSDPEYFWWTQDKPFPVSGVTEVYTDAGLTTVYNPANIGAAAKAGGTLYIKLPTATDARQFPENTIVLLYGALVVGYHQGIRARVASINDSTGYVAVVLLEDDIAVTVDHVPGTFEHAYLELSNVKAGGTIVSIGSAYAEGAGIGIPFKSEPVKLSNYTQIFRTPLSHTRTFKKTKFRTGDQVKAAKDEAAALHYEGIERALLFGKKMEEVDPVTGNPRRYSGGLLEFMSAGSKMRFSGSSWLGTAETDGWNWFNQIMTDMFLYGQDERLCLCGGNFMLKLNALAESRGKGLTITSETTSFGLSFTSFTLPTGQKVLFKTHAMFGLMPGFTNAGLFLDPDTISINSIDKTSYMPDRQANDIDGEKSEFLCEEGFEFHCPDNNRLLFI